jgi:hypothetical protein
MAGEFANALHQRGVDPDIAELAAHVGVQIFRTAYRRWLEHRDEPDLRAATNTVVSLLATIVPGQPVGHARETAG